MDDASLLQEAPHRRFNPLTREWVLVSPHRTKRPWLGRVEKQAAADLPVYDPSCYLCPGNERADGARNPKYSSTFVFDNDFAALLPDGPSFEVDEGGLLVARAERGICRVICFSPRHDLTISRMTPKEIGEVIAVWAAEFRRLGQIDWVRHVQIFENRGALMGASNPHPHCQIWANASVPVLPEKELAAFREYRDVKKSCLLCEYLQLELRRGERVICENEAFAAMVPFWAVWPFETLLVSKRHFRQSTRSRATRRRCWAIFCGGSPLVMTICLRHRFLIRWDFISVRRMVETIRNGIFMHTIFRRSCDRRRCKNLWLDMSCWGIRSGTLPRRALPCG